MALWRKKHVITQVFPIAVALAFAVGAVVELSFMRSRTFTIAGALGEADTAVVTISGRATPAGPNVFVLRDSTGAAALQTCPRWYREIRLGKNEQVTVTGEILRNDTPPEGTLYTLAVYSIARKDGAEVVLRTSMGKPPWATSYVLR